MTEAVTVPTTDNEEHELAERRRRAIRAFKERPMSDVRSAPKSEDERDD